MKCWQQVLGLGSMVLGVLGMGLVLTNPGPEDYEEFAALRLTEYLKVNLCNQLPGNMGRFSQECRFFGHTLIDIGQPKFQRFIGGRTERENYLLFSIYRTSLSLKPLAGSYEFGTIGVLQQFYLYQIETD